MKQGKRFSVVNAWRNIGTTPIQRAPLVFLPMHYQETNMQFPKGTPNFSNSVWYSYPNMTTKELLLFCQYDRHVKYTSDLWHCALKQVGVDAPPRESFDVRAMVIFDETVPPDMDRLRASQLVV